MQTALVCLKAVADACGLPFDPAAGSERSGFGAAAPGPDILVPMAAEAGRNATPRQQNSL
ncbi:hypothetical protein GTA51_06025 [Desulfovibrio aerotolerans]|uniref:Uncharacterized protein n=1 Tax=Solidesulfovibrio aerotolerans TaxID=295255 RepID=A0A7C9MNH2_9BACT|nr:hypothetical protein [Solidesulfovibrio aerotolerans]MYL82692.1 hypothetical protein [Solidesulfovibrio aerotolerans]